MSKFSNSKKIAFLDTIPTSSIEHESDNIAARCKFNFSYFTEQSAGQSFGDWSKEQLTDLLLKLKDYSREPLSYWIAQQALVIYGNFPKKSDFSHPKHVPIDAQWARFRLESTVRLVGFVVPGNLHGRTTKKTKFAFDNNTFYVVFLDENHLFFKTEPR